MESTFKPLWKHQKEAIDRARNLRDFGLFFEQGTGKTRTVIEIIAEKFKSSGMKKTLIIAPPIVLTNWARELGEFAGDCFKFKKPVVLYGSGKQRLKEFLAKKDSHHVFITNYETLMMPEILEQFHIWKPQILICDESQRLKNHSSKRAKALIQISEWTEHNYILTGTPVLDGKGLDLFMQFRILDRGETFGKNFFMFRARFFRDVNAGMNKMMHFPLWRPRKDKLAEFSEMINKKSMRVEKKDCLDLPPLIEKEIEVDLGPSQMKVYESMRDDMISFVKNQEAGGAQKAVVANFAITKGLRLQQISSGFVVTEDDKQVIDLKENPKLDALEELLTEICEGNTTKVIVWCIFKHNYKQISELCKKLKLKYEFLNGEQSFQERERAIHNFRKGDGQVLIANPQAGGVGVNLIEAPYMIYYTRSFSLEDQLQSAARNYRGGSEIHEKITMYNIVARNTIDVLSIKKNLEQKEDFAQKLLAFSP